LNSNRFTPIYARVCEIPDHTLSSIASDQNTAGREPNVPFVRIGNMRYACRTLLKSPGFSAIAILSIALGVGLNTAMFSFVDAILLRPLPVPDSGRIIVVDSTAPGTRLGNLSYPDYTELRDRTRTLSALVCYELIPMGVSASREGAAQMNLGVIVSGNYFSGLGIDIPVGRAFRADEDVTPGKDLVAVISYSFWEREFGSDSGAIGRKLRLNGSDFTVIGVAPQGFLGPEAYVVSDVYVPMHAYPQAIPNSTGSFLTGRGKRELTLVGRLKSGVSATRAHAELSTIARNIAQQYPDTNRNRTVTVLGYLSARFEQDPTDAILAIMLLVISGPVLLIACANVANLLLARGTARVKEIAIRMAIGGSRWRLVRQFLTESLLLALAGGAAGLAVAYGGVQFLASVHLPSDFPLSFGVRMDSRLLVFGFAVAITTGLVCGLLPALRFTRSDLSSIIKASDSGPGNAFWRGRLAGRNVLVTAQLALSVVLLIVSAFFVRGFDAARRIDSGFRIDHTLFFTLDPGMMRYDEAKAREFYRKLEDRLRDQAGVRDVTLASSIPYSNGGQNFRPVIADGYQGRPGEDAPSAWSYIVDEHYFPVMETHIVRGRAFDERDSAASPRVAVVNETLAARAWPNRDPIGQRMRLDGPNGPLVEVVGVAKDGKYLYWAEPRQSAVWIPSKQVYNSQMKVIVRTEGDPAAMAAVIRENVRALDADMPVVNLSTMARHFEERAMLGPRLIAQIVTAIGLVGLLLAVIGLYGVVAYAVGRRTREIGIRMALGARPVDVLGMVLSQGLIFTLIGIALGLAIALSASGFLQNFIVGVSPHDPLILIGVPAILAAVMMAACWLPARRASRVDPTLALRQD
jgi:predicted permease